MFGRNKDRPSERAEERRIARPSEPPAPKPVGSRGQLAYEARRAEKAGMGLEKWMAEKSRRVQDQRAAAAKAQRKAAAATAKPGLLRRLLDRAHKPL